MRVRTIIVAAALLTVSTGAAVGQTTAPGPITNGDFESFTAPDEVTEPLEGTPADECIGIGHQVDWGTDTPQGDLTGDEFDGMPDEADPDPTQLVARYEDDPSRATQDAEEQAGYGYCEFSTEKGEDKYWLNPSSAGGTTDKDAAFWSQGSDASVGFTFDDERFDKEIGIESNPSNGGDHNLWQNVFHPGRGFAYSANVDALEFDLEDGSIPADASVKVSLGAEPLNVQERFAVIYIDCVLSFPGTYLQDELGPNGRVSASPVGNGVNYDGADDPDCPDELSRENLGRLSIIQISFWDFNDGTERVAIDNVALPGATTHAEEAASGNFRVCTDVAGPADDATCGQSTAGKE